MSGGVAGLEERVARVRRLLGAAAVVHRDRGRIAGAIAATTGLTPEGVEAGFDLLERDAPDAALRALVAGVARAPRVHVVLSANVFVAPLRALALARAASDLVTVRPSPRDPTLARALVEEAGAGAMTITEERDVGAIEDGEIHVYGRDETISAVRARARSGVVVRGHGAGLGAVVVTRAADLDAAARDVAADVVLFDQRGCLSPRVVLVEGDPARGRAFARALDEALSGWERTVPRGRLSDDERTQLASWRDASTFAGDVWLGPAHAVALAPSGSPLQLPPTGRHVHVAVEPSLERVASRLALIARFIVALGTDDPARVGAIAPAGARVGPLGRMQRPPLDGPVDRRPF